MSDWNTKYRPKNLSEFKGQSFTIEKLKLLSERIWEGETDLPSLMFSGGFGVGKTTAAKAFLKHTFGDAWNRNFHEVNSSTMGKIDTVRNEIKDWCSNRTIGTYTTPKGVERSIPYTIIFLDEVDGMSTQAQFGLRRVMEDYSNVVFILSCNYIHKVLKPIQDRCMPFHFPPYTNEDLVAMMTNIVQGEGINISLENLKLIAEHSHGSARRSQKLLQKVSLTRGDITREEVMKNLDTMDEKFDDSLLIRIIQANFIKNENSEQYEAVHKEFSDLLWHYREKGYAGEDVMKAIVESIKNSNHDVTIKKFLFKNIADTIYKGSFTDDFYFFIEMWARSIGVDD